jgi:hypothetical protein
MFQKLVELRFLLPQTTPIWRAKWFWVLLLFGFSYSSPGQIPAYAYTRTDTIRAIQFLFDQKRTGGQITTAVGVPIAIGGAVGGFLSSTLSSLVTLGKTKKSILPITILSGSIGLTPTVLGIDRLIRYSRRREDALIDAYESGAPLSAFVRRELKPRHFEFTIKTPVNPLF